MDKSINDTIKKVFKIISYLTIKIFSLLKIVFNCVQLFKDFCLRKEPIIEIKIENTTSSEIKSLQRTKNKVCVFFGNRPLELWLCTKTSDIRKQYLKKGYQVEDLTNKTREECLARLISRRESSGTYECFKIIILDHNFHNNKIIVWNGELRPKEIFNIFEEKFGFNLTCELTFFIYNCCSIRMENQDAADSEENIEHTLTPFILETNANTDKNYKVKNGLFVLITNSEYNNNVGLLSNDIDVPKIMDFASQKVSSFKLFKNTNVNEIMNILDNLISSAEFQLYDGLVVIINAHGKEHEIEFKDGTIMVNQIIEKFNDINCPSLINKPKIIFINTCRGKEELSQRRKLKLNRNYSHRHIENNQMVGYSEMIIAHSTALGYITFGSLIDGTVYITELLLLFNNISDVMELFKKENYYDLSRIDINNKTYLYPCTESRGFTFNKCEIF